jgi:V/A-type H+-transporting ATPase subunit E
MSVELQSLLDKIQEEGMVKIDAERERILSEAKRKASQLIEEAGKEAETLLKNAKYENELMAKRGGEALRQASRDIIIALENEIQERIRQIIRENIGGTMTPEFMGRIILEMLKNRNYSGDIKLIVAKKDLDEMETLLRGALASDIRGCPDISIGHDFTSGIKVGFKGEDFFVDFSDDALSDMICAYAGHRIASVLREERKAGNK